ncbi:ubiquinol oxidase subunit II [Dyella sp. M7H15-1]|uniref:ubiquinol oxidase subunit II n=1 Tax=Dyella sp. M7H15-1 TaxID=2501295 RepID=UPI001004F5DF|nr:ubiquinol oxidase subunit II [Dyella sp. M7H15-1]QAU23155.1 ubiquinol oxidase subunit II [Dyella sp. M7H15-1]
MNKCSLVSALRWSCAGLAVFLSGCNLEVLSPKGDVGMQEKSLILIATGLMLLVVIPVIAMTLIFAWRYRASNTKATYAPKWSHSTAIEAVVWTVPCIIIAILATITWKTTHQLDPYKPLAHHAKPITIQAVSMDWKWVFIYPEYGVASVNELAFPANVPVNFQITSDSVMNAFFIPQLGSQIYAMAGMETKLHLIANEPGIYAGLSSNYSGAGFSDMHFNAIATSQQGFADWIDKAKASQLSLDEHAYHALTQASEKVPVTYYTHVKPGLFNDIIAQYMGEMQMDKLGAEPAQASVIPSHNDHAKAAE